MISRRKLIIVTALLALLLVLTLFILWLSSRGRLTVVVSQNVQQITVIGENYRNTVSNPSDITELSVPSGKYLVEISGDDGDFSALTNVPGFFQKRDINANLRPQDGRYFVANDSQSCVHPLGSSYVSYVCGGTMFSLVYHSQPTSTKPSLVVRAEDLFAESTSLDNPDPGVIEGVFDVNESTYALVRASENFGAGHFLYELKEAGGGFDIVFVRIIENLPSDTTFTVRRSGDKIIFIPREGRFYYSGNNLSSVERIELPEEEGLITISDVVNDGVLMSGFITEGDDINITASKGVLSSYKAETFNKRVTNRPLIKSSYCIREYICVLDDLGRLGVYDNNLNLLYAQNEVVNFYASSEYVYVVFDTHVVEYKIQDESLTGRYIYSSDYYSVDSMSLGDEYATINVRDRNNRSHTLQIDTANTNSIKEDVLLQPITESPFVQNASIGDRFVHLSLNLGERVINEETGSLKIDQKNLQAAEAELSSIIKNNKLKEQGYRFISPLINL